MSQPFEVLEPQLFEILEVHTREYSRFNTRGRQWNVSLNPPAEIPLPDPVTAFVDSVNNMFDHVLEYVRDADMVGITIHNKVSQSDKPIVFSYRRKDQIWSDVIWSVFDKLLQSNARFHPSDTLIVTVHSVTMPVGFGGNGMKLKGRPLANMVNLRGLLEKYPTVFFMQTPDGL